MKTIKKSNLFTTTVLMLFIFSIIGFWGCEKENFFENSDTAYLDLETYEFDKMSVKEMEIITQAIGRLDVKSKNGLYQIKQKSGAQINISEELFDYIKNGYECTNNTFKSKSINSPIVRLKSGEIEADGDQDTTHCVAYALAAMGGVTLEDAIAYCDSLFGSNGVPLSALDLVVRHFYPKAFGTTTPRSAGAMNYPLVYYPTSDSSGHAVNGYYFSPSNGIVLYKDYQNGVFAPISVDSIEIIYYTQP